MLLKFWLHPSAQKLDYAFARKIPWHAHRKIPMSQLAAPAWRDLANRRASAPGLIREPLCPRADAAWLATNDSLVTARRASVPILKPLLGGSAPTLNSWGLNASDERSVRTHSRHLHDVRVSSPSGSERHHFEQRHSLARRAVQQHAAPKNNQPLNQPGDRVDWFRDRTSSTRRCLERLRHHSLVEPLWVPPRV